MDIAKQHWPILRDLGADLANRVRSYMVIGRCGDGVLVTTEDSDGCYWLGTMRLEFGISKTVTKPVRFDVPGVVIQMAKGNGQILLLTESGQIYTIKRNYEKLYLGMFKMGSLSDEIRFSPQLISIPSHKFISVRCGKEHSLALTEDGKVWSWGENKVGQLGLSKITEILQTPCKISKLDPYRIIAVECGDRHSLALTDQGDVYAWGGNHLEQVGYEYESYRRNFMQITTPTRIPTPSPVKSIAAGLHYTLLLTRTGEVWACGSNKFSELALSTTTESSGRLVKVAGLPPILQISAHALTSLSIAMSFDRRCFIWGQLPDKTTITTPRKLSSFYSTVESPLSIYSLHRNTPHSIIISENSSIRLSTKMSRMFDNLETNCDVQFVVEQRAIYAHRNILSNSSDYFNRMFSERWLPQVNTVDPIFKVTIPDHSYYAFHAFLHFLYTDSFEVYPDFLSELFELASLYLVPELQKLCLWRMRTTLTIATCCLYYPLTNRHSQLPELATFQQELVQFASTQMSEVVHSASYHLMEPDLHDILSKAVENFQIQCK